MSSMRLKFKPKPTLSSRSKVIKSPSLFNISKDSQTINGKIIQTVESSTKGVKTNRGVKQDCKIKSALPYNEIGTTFSRMAIDQSASASTKPEPNINDKLYGEHPLFGVCNNNDVSQNKRYDAQSVPFKFINAFTSTECHQDSKPRNNDANHEQQTGRRFKSKWATKKSIDKSVVKKPMEEEAIIINGSCIGIGEKNNVPLPNTNMKLNSPLNEETKSTMGSHLFHRPLPNAYEMQPPRLTKKENTDKMLVEMVKPIDYRESTIPNRAMENCKLTECLNHTSTSNNICMKLDLSGKRVELDDDAKCLASSNVETSGENNWARNNSDRQTSGPEIVSIRYVGIDEIKSMKTEFQNVSTLYEQKYNKLDFESFKEADITTKLADAIPVQQRSNNPLIRIYLNCWPKEWEEDRYNNQNQNSLYCPANTLYVLLKSVNSNEKNNFTDVDNSVSTDLPLSLSTPILPTVSDSVNCTFKDNGLRIKENGNGSIGRITKKNVKIPQKIRLSKYSNQFSKKANCSKIKNEIPNKVKSDVNLKNGLLKSFAKPVPKVLGDKKIDKNDELDVSKLIKPWPKNIRTYYGKTSYQMRQKYLQRYPKGPIDADKLKMIDLIFYNPPTNPMTKNSDEKVVTSKHCNSSGDNSNNMEGTEKEIDDVVPVPQLKVGPEGCLIIDPKSMPAKSGQVHKNEEENVGILKTPTKRKVSEQRRSWSHSETIKFYKALHTVGADFTVMSTLFPNRTRKTLKLKFKREEKLNGALIDKVLMNPASFDVEALKKELEEDDKTSEEANKIKKAESHSTLTPNQNMRGKKVNIGKTSRFKFDTTEPDLPARKRPRPSPNPVPHDILNEESMNLLRACSKLSYVGKSNKSSDDYNDALNKQKPSKKLALQITESPLIANTNDFIKKAKIKKINSHNMKNRGRKVNHMFQNSFDELQLDEKIILNANEEIKLENIKDCAENIMVFDFTSDDHCIKSLAEFNKVKRSENLGKMEKISVDTCLHSFSKKESPTEKSSVSCSIFKEGNAKRTTGLTRKQPSKTRKTSTSHKRTVGKPKLRVSNKNAKAKITSKSEPEICIQQIRNLQSIAAEGLVEDDVESVDVSPQPEKKQIVINTSIEYNTLNIMRSVSYDPKNFNQPLDINTTIDHQPNICNKSN